MALKIQPKLLSSKLIAFVAVFALVAQPVYGVVVSQVANAAPQVVKNANTNEEFTTIQAAIDDTDTANGHVITATAGTYNESITITKSVAIKGAQAGTDARTRSIDAAGESIVNSGQTAFTIAAKDVTIDGFQVAQTSGATAHAINMTSNFSGTKLANNIVTRTGTGSAMHLYGGEGNTVQNNFLRDIAANGIVMRNGNLVSPVATHQKIVDNKIDNIRSMNGGSIVVYGQTDLEIARNNITAAFQGISLGAVGGAHYYMNNVRVHDNTINLILDSTQPNVYRHAVLVEGNGEGVVVKNNNIKQSGETPTQTTRYALIRVSFNDVPVSSANPTGLAITENNLESNATDRYVVVGQNVTNEISVANNWWGNQVSPIGKVVSPNATIATSPWLCQPFEQGLTASVAGNCTAPALSVPTGLSYESPVRDCGAVTNVNYSKPVWDAIPGATYEYQALFNGSIVYGPVSFATNQHPGGVFGGGQNGEWAFQVRSVNSDGVKSDWSASCSVILDTSAPSAPLAKINNLTGTVYTNQNSILTTWTQPSGDPVKYNYASWHNIAAQPFNSEESAYENPGVTSLSQSGTFPFGEGKYSVKVQAVDQAGNLSPWSNTVNVVYDKTAPSIAGVAVEKAITNETQVKVTGTVKDTNLKDYNVRVYNADKSAQVSPVIAYTGLSNVEAGTLATLNVSALPDGNYFVRVWADDLANNRAGIASHIYVPFTLDTKKPIATLTYSNNNGNTKNNVVVTLTVDEAVQDIAGWTRNGVSNIFTKTFTDNTKFNVTVVDLAGNSLVEAGEVKRIDRNAPTISGVANGVTVNTPVTLTIFDPKFQNVDGYSEVNGLKVNGITVPTIVGANKTYLATISQDGSYTVVATDKAGNASEPLTFVIDSAAPVVTVADIAPITVGGEAKVSGTVNDPAVATVEIFVDGVSVGTAAIVSGEFDFDLTGLAIGSHNVMVKAVDAATNVGTSTVKTVVVSAAPVVSPASITGGLVALGGPSPAAQPAANVAVVDNNADVVVEDAEVLGESTQNNVNDDTKEVLAATTTPEVKGASDFAPFGVAWYWWLLLVAALGAAAWWFIAAARRRQSEEL